GVIIYFGVSTLPRLPHLMVVGRLRVRPPLTNHCATLVHPRVEIGQKCPLCQTEEKLPLRMGLSLVKSKRVFIQVVPKFCTNRRLSYASQLRVRQ
ncbi:MAG: hypothetical protein KAK04_07060, partial [Cyclobacteriaceae bacterium]|nr:hypothetical protein [Cyclobacteriaceae bacterium]